MPSGYLLIALLGLSTAAYYLGRRKAFALAGRAEGAVKLHSRPNYHGALTALWCAIPALLLFGFWLAFETEVITLLRIKDLPESIRSLPADRLNLVINDIRNLESGSFVSQTTDPAMQAAADHYSRLRSISHNALAVITIALMAAAAVFVRLRIAPGLRARNHVEKILTVMLVGCSTIAIFTTIGIILSVLYEAIRFFNVIPITNFLFGLDWSPQMAIRADQVGSSGAFGAVPVFMGTILISAIAMADGFRRDEKGRAAWASERRVWVSPDPFSGQLASRHGAWGVRLGPQEQDVRFS